MQMVNKPESDIAVEWLKATSEQLEFEMLLVGFMSSHAGIFSNMVCAVRKLGLILLLLVTQQR